MKLLPLASPRPAPSHTPSRRYARPLLLQALAAALGPVQAQTGDPSLCISRVPAQVPVAAPATASASTPEAAPGALWTSQAAQYQPGNRACAQSTAPRWDQLSLPDALASHLCKNPELRQALADVAEQAALVDATEASAQPRLNANADFNSSRNFNSSGNSGRTAGLSVGLSWVLFDFGQSSANLRASRQTLAAAMARQGGALLDSVQILMQRYGAAVVALAALESTTEAEATAARTEAAAMARYEAKVGSQIDLLQAQTALAQASLERVRAQSAWENARGELALSLGGDIAQPLRLAGWEAWSRPVHALPDIEALRSEARQQHPRLRAVQAQMASIQSRLDAASAESRGNVTVNASGGSSRNWGAAGSGSLPTASASVVASVPLFNGRETRAQQSQLLAQMQSQEAELDKARREIDSQLWQAHQALLTSRQSLQASERLLVSADSTYRVAQGRYRSGVGSMLELLSAQTALADARRQRVAAQIEQLTAQTRLSLASGRTGR